MWKHSPVRPEDMGTAKEKTIGWALAHAGATPENQNDTLISDHARHAIAMHFHDFMWVDREGGGFCTACRRYISARCGHGPHRSYERCPECGKTVEVRRLCYGHKKLHEEFCAVEWRKSAIDPGTVVMTGAFCELDSRGEDPREAEKRITPMQLIVFQYGKGSARFQRCVYNWDTPSQDEPWHMIRSVSRIGSRYFGHRTDVVASEANFRAAIAGTPFASAWAALEEAAPVCADHCEEMDAIARRPWLEYMAKAGFRKIAREAMGVTPKGVLNTRRKNVREILRLSRDRYAELKGRHADISIEELQVLQMAGEAGCRIRLEEAQKIAGAHWYDARLVMKAYGGLDRQLIRFLQKADWNRLRTLRDYLEAAREVGIDLTAPDARLPRNLDEAHDRAVHLRIDMRQARRTAEKKERDRSRQKKLDGRLPELEEKYCFTHGGLVLRPARSPVELIDEGNALKHCVGGYVDRYADGSTDICFLRPESAPDTPWRTVEFSTVTGRMVQDRGYNNDRAGNQSTMTPELRAQLDEFWAAYWNWRGKEKARKTV